MKLKGLFALLSLLSSFLIFSCTKINEATQLGDDLLPAVDNINTFDTTIRLDAAYHPFDDTSKHYISDNMALGRINDPLFGTANADMYFNLSSGASGTSYGTYPFGTDITSVDGIDSVVLSLSYQGAYGDSLSSVLTVQVSEIASSTNFNDDTLYRFNTPSFNSGSTLGSKTFSITTLDDSIPVRRGTDTTTKVANVLRIPLDKSLAVKLMSFDTTSTTGSGGYYSDSVFRKLFRGLAVKTTSASGRGAFAYFNLYDLTKTQLIVYYRQKTTSGTIDSAASAVFVHSRYGQANSIIRNPSGSQYLANMDKPTSQLFYLQSSPSGSYVSIKIPNFETFPNKVIHRAELIANQVSDPDNVYFAVPNLLFLDHKGPYGGTAIDTAYFFEKDIATTTTGTFDYTTFGGAIKSDNAYHFNITRYIQGLVTLKGRNDSLRLYAPIRAYDYEPSTKLLLAYPYNNILDNPAKGRVVIAGSNYADLSKRLRLRIVYSNL